MRSRAVRVTLTLLAFAAAGAAAYSYWTTHKRINAAFQAAAAFSHARQSAARASYDLRAAQQAYVAAGQNEGFWFQKVSASIDALRAALSELERTTGSSAARTALTEVSATLQDFEERDRRVRGYVTSGQRLLASDIIFSDGLELTSSLLAGLDAAAEHARQDLAAVRAGVEREQMIAAAAATGTALLVVLLLAPVGTSPAPEPAQTAAGRPGAQSTTGLDLRTAAAPRVDEKTTGVTVPKTTTTAPAASAGSGRTVAKSAAAPPARAGGPAPELGDLARVCTELARLSDSSAVPAILARTASALRASGLVLWVADAERKQLIPIAAHGYPPNVLSRMGALPAESENATAAAFRTGLVQTVRADGKSNGAIAAPLVAPTGCVGVMSVEVGDGGEKEASRLAAASIVAAQLATIVGPPAAHAGESNSAAL